MKAVVYLKPGEFVIEERPVPEIEDQSDAIVRVTLASICSSDIHIRNGCVPRAKPGIIVGHEMVGVVEKTGSNVRTVKPGDRVAVNVETFCGHCFFCERGFVNNCSDKNGGWALGCRIDGGQTEFVRIPFADSGLSKIPENVTDEQALFVGDILSTGYWAAEISEICKGDTVAVIGAGPAGICSMMCARLFEPAKIIALDIDENRLAFAEKYGLADATVNPEKDDPETILKNLTDGRGADVVIEAAGGKNTFETAWKIARPNATVTVVALYEEDQILPLPRMYGKNLTFKTGGVDANACGKILKLISEGKIDASILITHEFPLEKAMDAYRLFEAKEDSVMKTALRI